MAAPWTPVTGKPRSVQVTQAVPTDSAPSAVDDGVDLSSLKALAVYYHAPPGQTFTGTGTLVCYVWRPSRGWKRYKALDYDMGDAAGLDEAILPPFDVKAPIARLAFVPLNVAVSGGAQVTADYVGVNATTLGEEL